MFIHSKSIFTISDRVSDTEVFLFAGHSKSIIKNVLNSTPVVAYLSRSQVRLKCETVKMEGTRLKIVLLFESFLFSTTLLVIATMIYEYEYIWSCLVQLMNEKDEQQGLNLKWLTILFAFGWYGIWA